MDPQPADRSCCIALGSKNASVALLGTRSTLVPSARSGLKVFFTWLGVISIRMLSATPSDGAVRAPSTGPLGRQAESQHAAGTRHAARAQAAKFLEAQFKIMVDSPNAKTNLFTHARAGAEFRARSSSCRESRA